MWTIQNNTKDTTVKIIQKISNHQSLQLLKKLIQPLIGEFCWLVKTSYGDELTIHSGNKIPYKSNKMSRFEKGEWIIGSRASYWKLEAHSETIINSRGDIGDIKFKSKVIESKTITDIDILYPEMILTVIFGDEYKLQIFPDNDNWDLPYWEIFMPDNKLVQLESKTQWAYFNADKFFVDSYFIPRDIYESMEYISYGFLTTNSLRSFLYTYPSLSKNHSLQEQSIQSLIEKLEQRCLLLKTGLELICLNSTNNLDVSDLYYDAIFNSYVYNGFIDFASLMISNRYATRNYKPEHFVNLFSIDLQKYHLNSSEFHSLWKFIDSILNKNKFFHLYKKDFAEISNKDQLSLVDFIKLSRLTHSLIEKGFLIKTTKRFLENYKLFIQTISCALGLCLVIACETISLFTEDTIENPR